MHRVIARGGWRGKRAALERVAGEGCEGGRQGLAEAAWAGERRRLQRPIPTKLPHKFERISVRLVEKLSW